jgi:hypothetical protein
MASTKTNIRLNINKDDANINDFIYVWDFYNKRPNKITIHKSFLSQEFEETIKQHTKDRNIFSEIIPADGENIVNDKVLAHLEIDNSEFFISYVVIDKNFEASSVSDTTIYYKEESQIDTINKLIEELEECHIEFCDEEVNNLNTIYISNSSGLDLEPVSTTVDLDSIEMYYNSQTMKNLNKLVKKIKKSSNGLSILYGERGTGKTGAISYIANKLDRIVIFIPNNMIEHTINNPDFRKFIKRYSKPILVLDDCEMMFNDYLNKSNIISNNLLQLSDGFLSELVDVTFITIFNCEEEYEIDHNLLECNNLLDVVEFSLLNEDESNELASYLGEKPKFKNKNKLVDIIKKRSSLNNKKIGF